MAEHEAPRDAAEDPRHGHREERDRTGRTDAPGSGYGILDRINNVVLKVYGPAARRPAAEHGADESAVVRHWYEQMQEHFVVERDERGNEYLYHRDDVPEEPPPGASHNW
ncbi:hypothetical protein MRU69_00935 [Kocuria flava]|uniref:hypothetical protein n=1 Tax=Kocuria flava TaxID=446860 RepID=UPI001FF4EF13|nr:hypothetical protein [Kocuria flava]MCJ8503430.1 hypothetical protein [Kocuria flava]